MLVTMRYLDTNLKVGFATLAAAADDIRTTVTSITTALTDLHTDVEARLAEWEGGARTEYLNTKAVWDTAATNIKNSLSSLATAVDSANEIMYTTEQTNQNNLQF